MSHLIKYAVALLIVFAFTACSKDQVQEQKKVINKYIVVDAYSQDIGLPYTMDLNGDGVSDVEITGDGTVSGSSGSKSELYIQGVNGTSVCFQTKHDTSWIVDVFTGTYDTLILYNSYKQPAVFNLGDEINDQLNYSDTLLIVFHKHNKGTMGIPSSDINRTELLDDAFRFFAVKTPTGVHWIKIKIGMPTTIIESYSTVRSASILIIEE